MAPFMLYCRAMLRLWSIVLAVAVSGGCIIDTVPTPDDTPRRPAQDGTGGTGYENGDDSGVPAVPGAAIDGTSIFYSAYSAVPVVLIVGAEGAVAGLGAIEVENSSRGVFTTRASSANGSFSLIVDGAVGETLVLSFVQNDVRLDTLQIAIEPGSSAATENSRNMAGAPPDANAGGSMGSTLVFVTAPDAAGFVTVYGVAGSVVQGITVAITDSSTGAATSAAANVDGSFESRLPASTGDEIIIFAVEPAASNSGGATLTIYVP